MVNNRYFYGATLTIPIPLIELLVLANYAFASYILILDWHIHYGRQNNSLVYEFSFYDAGGSGLA